MRLEGPGGGEGGGERGFSFAVVGGRYGSPMDSPRRVEDAPPLWGRSLRFVLLAEVRRRGRMSVADMVTYLADNGYEIMGRPSKTISDALRWEVARGRVVRIRRGWYGYGRTPRTTARRVMLFAERCEAWIMAILAGEVPPPTPPTRHDRAQGHQCFGEDPARPPWSNLGWLWTT